MQAQYSVARHTNGVALNRKPLCDLLRCRERRWEGFWRRGKGIVARGKTHERKLPVYKLLA